MPSTEQSRVISDYCKISLIKSRQILSVTVRPADTKTYNLKLLDNFSIHTKIFFKKMIF